MLRLDEEKKRFIETIGNPLRLKTLLVLWKSNQELTLHKICQRAGLGKSPVSRHLRNLLETGIVSRRIYAEIALYAFRRDDRGALALIEFFAKTKF